MEKSKISTRFFKVIIYISISVLLLAFIISYFIVKDINTDAQIMVKNNISIKIENKIKNYLQVGITNAISISKNKSLVEALINNDKDSAYDILYELSQEYIRSSQYKNPQIHIHTSDVTSFMRSWDKDHNGDPLKEFRHTINRVKKTKSAVTAIEVGWADLVIRGIVPIIDKGKYVGSLEFIQDFSSIEKELEKENKHLLALVDTTLLKNIQNTETVINKYALVQKKYDTESFNILKNLDFDELIKKGYMKQEGKIFITKEIRGFNNSFIGYYVIIHDAKAINNIISKSQEIANMFIGLMILMTVIMIIMLNKIVEQLITQNLTKVSDGLVSFFNYLNKKSNSIETIDIQTHDEIGQMALEINDNIEYIKILIEKENQDNWIKAGVGKLNKKLLTISKKVDISNVSVGFLCEYLNAGVGALYINSEDNKELTLEGTYAFVKRNSLSNIFKLGEGVVGQVALQRSPILLQNIERTNIHIVTGTTDEPSFNTYTFPLI
ncbi:MAG: cache domain-containing protein, partial [Campylobacterota bacterium]|nr:cache domain-containing protein [Campylobacterota bacterium]